jgi:valyl-tRNA synthetase
VWSWWQQGSVHRAAWPAVDELGPAARTGDPAVLADAGRVLGEVRRAKTEAKLSMRAPVARMTVRGHAAARRAAADLQDAGHVAELLFDEGDDAVEITLAG